MSRRRITRWKCGFCDCHLHKAKFGIGSILAALFLMRPSYCKHCFARYVRPFELILIAKRSLRFLILNPLSRLFRKPRKKPLLHGAPVSPASPSITSPLPQPLAAGSQTDSDFAVFG